MAFVDCGNLVIHSILSMPFLNLIYDMLKVFNFRLKKIHLSQFNQNPILQHFIPFQIYFSNIIQ